MNIRCFGSGCWRFRLTATYFFTSAKKSKQKTLAPAFGPRRLGFLRYGIDPGAAAPVCFAAPPSAVSGCARRSLRSHARINPSTQPSDVAGGSRSRALELALIVEWCGFAAGSCAALLLLLWERACSRRRSARQPIPIEFTRSNCRSCRRLRSFDLAFAFVFALAFDPALDLFPLRQASLQDRSRNEGTPSFSERAVRRGKAFWVTFLLGRHSGV